MGKVRYFPVAGEASARKRILSELERIYMVSARCGCRSMKSARKAVPNMCNERPHV